MTDTQPVPDFSRGNDGLLPAIAQDEATGRVLMLAWMNQEAWQATLSTMTATYWSRSRGSLWKKGETSGHRQTVTDIRVDCDADAILLTVRQVGAACHDGFHSCFYRTVAADGVVQIADDRLVDPRTVYGDDN